LLKNKVSRLGLFPVSIITAQILAQTLAQTVAEICENFEIDAEQIENPQEVT